MYSKLKKLELILIINATLFLIFTQSIRACTYNATITDKHLDFEITSDPGTVGLIQYIKRSGNFNVTKMYAPEIGQPWVFSSDPNCNVYSILPLACRQNRGQLGDGAFWIWSVNGDGNFPNHVLPTGIWGLDFDSVPTWDSIGIEYGSTNGQSGDYWHFCTRTGEINQTTPSPTPSPTTSPTSTPSPVPTPTPAPESKTVYFVPGLGASWNLNAFANCKFDNNPNNWSLASYAESVYNPLLSALKSSGYDTNNFYYDWKQEINKNAGTLQTLMENNVNSENKVNLVGHSMGGLIAKNYLDNTQGKNVIKFISLGSPFKGSVLSYPAWSGGDIWEDNFIQKIAMTLYLKHCGGILPNDINTIRSYIPSVNNLLPTFDYLKFQKSNSFKPVTEMDSRNLWNANLNSIIPGVSIQTISGNGFSTLSAIQIKDASKKEAASGLWIDGKPLKKLSSISGDGTVLTESSMLPGAENIIINQNHSGLVNSEEGINKVLDFLGSVNSNIIASNGIEENSALVLISDSANFTITEDTGKTKTAKNGMISLINPKSEKLKLSLIPKNYKTLFVIAQFLTDGKVLYKEYIFNNYLPKFKTIDFKSENTSEDILK